MNILVVSNPDDRAEIVDILVGAGYRHLTVGDGDDETLASYQRDEPSLVVMCANLDRGDARSLAATMRDAPQGELVKIVLIGEVDGPIRNALDATDFDVDRFLARPLSSKALVFAVRSCLEALASISSAAPVAVPVPPIAPSQPSPGREIQAQPGLDLEKKMEKAMNQAIDAFVRDAIDALPRPQPGRPRPQPEWQKPERQKPERLQSVPSNPQPGQAGARRTRPTLVASPPPLIRTDIADDIAGADSEPAPEFELEKVIVRPEGELEPETPGPQTPIDRESPVEPAAVAAAGVDAMPSWRQPTVILPDAGVAPEPDPDPVQPAPASAADSESDHRGGDDAGDDAGNDLDRGDLDDESDVPEVSGAEFARELRRKMSAMAERLFPGKQAKKPVSPVLAHDHLTEIDLSALDAEPAPSAVGDDATGSGLPDELQGEVSPAVPPPPPEAASSGSLPVAGAEPRPSAGPVTRAVSEPSSSGGEICRGEADAAILIERMFRRRLTGRVEFHRDGVTKDIIFDGGRLVFATSNSPEDRMGQQLYREGKITAEQFEQVRARIAASGRRMGEVLIELGWLKRRELLPVVRRHIEDLIYSLFAWDSGQYRIVEGEFATGERIRISRHPASMILEGVRRKYKRDSLLALVGSPKSVIEIVDDRQLKTVMSVADLTSAERKVMVSFNGERSLDDIHAASALDLLAVFQLAYGLIVWGAAQPLRRGEDGAVAAAEESALVGATDLAIDRQRVLAKYSLVDEADYFTLLGVRRDATSFEIRRAYEAARRDYASEGFPPDVRRELGPQIAEIGELLEEAYQVLRDDGLRAAYLANLCD